MKFISAAGLFFSRNKLFNELKFSLKLQYEKREEIIKFQNEKFIKLINHAKENVPYYSYILKDVKDIYDLSQIPFLTKDIIKEKNFALKAKNIPGRDFIKNSTSGSTGKSMLFYSDKKNTYSKACSLRGDMLSGWEYGEKYVLIWGAHRDINKHPSLQALLNKKYIQKYEILSTFNLSEEDIEKYIDFFNYNKPVIIIGYPTGLFLIANHILKFNKRVINSKAIISAGETLYEFQREVIEKAFQQKVFNRYGCREVKHIASECKEHTGLHISADHVIVEIVDDKGETARPGELGEIVVTDLDNYAFPFIRYKIGDIGILKEPGFKCNCGVNLPMLEKVEGRTMDIIVGTNGNRVTGSFWTLFFRHNFVGIEKFQVIQETLGSISIYFEINGSYDPKEEVKIKNEIKRLLGADTIIEITVVKEISKTTTGKHRWIISKVNPYV